MRVYQRDRAGIPQITGEAPIDHTPENETVHLRIGEAFDVVADRVQTDYRALTSNSSESAYEISIRNRKKEAVTVLVTEGPARVRERRGPTTAPFARPSWKRCRA